MCKIKFDCSGCSCHISPPCWHCLQGHDLSVAERIELGYAERECGHRVGYTKMYKMLVCPTCAKDIISYAQCKKHNDYGYVWLNYKLIYSSLS